MGTGVSSSSKDVVIIQKMNQILCMPYHSNMLSPPHCLPIVHAFSIHQDATIYGIVGYVVEAPH